LLQLAFSKTINLDASRNKLNKLTALFLEWLTQTLHKDTRTHTCIHTQPRPFNKTIQWGSTKNKF